MRIKKEVFYTLVCSALTLISVEALAGFKIIVNKSTEIRKGTKAASLTSISKKDIRDIFFEQKQWNNGTPIQVVTFASGTPEEADFDKQVLGRTTTEIKKLFLLKVFNNALEPKNGEDAGEIIKFVTQIPGAIGYVPDSIATKEAVSLKITD